MAELEVKGILSIDTKKPVESIKELRNNVKSYRDELVKAERGTHYYEAALNGLVKSQNELNRINREVRASTQNFTQTLSQLTNVGNGVVSGFNAITSATALWGGENEALANTLVKLQAGLALTQQLKAVTSGVRSANTAFRALNVTISSSPIFIIAGVLSGIILTLISLSNSTDSVKKSVDNLKKSLEDFNTSIDESEKLVSIQINALRRLGVAERELIEIRNSSLNQSKEEAQNRLADLNTEINYYEVLLSKKKVKNQMSITRN